jgi:lipid II:glycine glycyltransferase (peptidoglycan interpeptide bridge formation enzyme)
MDLRQTPQFAEYIKLLGWIVSSIGRSTSSREKRNNVFIRKIPVIGSVIKLQRPENLDNKLIKRLSDLARKHRAFQISVEPLTINHRPLIIKSGYKLNKSPSLCTKTVQVDLTKSENKILSEMHHKTRYNIKIAKRRGVEVYLSKDIKKFSEFWQKCALKQRHMFLPMKREIIAIHTSFGKDAHILFANAQDNDTAFLSSRTNTVSKAISNSSMSSKKRLLPRSTPRNDTTVPLAAILLIVADRTAYYMYAASTGQGKKLFAPTLVAWKSIKLAKKLGCKLFDFEGIYDERFPIPSWKGFSRFKKSFGGREIEYPGAFVKTRLPF